MLAGAKLVAFGATIHPADAVAFYTKVLGLSLRYEDSFAISLESGIWLAPSGARIAWFKDPDGSLLSVAQYAAG
jgi:predicted enzyme related to lactoylglutathione lyase